jgi:hypothetical protein
MDAADLVTITRFAIKLSLIRDPIGGGGSRLEGEITLVDQRLERRAGASVASTLELRTSRARVNRCAPDRSGFSTRDSSGARSRPTRAHP